MKLFETKHLIALLGVLTLIVSGCASGGSKPTPQQFEAPETVAEEPDKNLFSQALKAQNEGQFDSAIKLWKSFLSKHPKSFEGHNNLGLLYYTQDMLSQALSEFEIAYRLNREDDKIRKNLARALRFKANMLHENREYIPTLEILARLELIVDPEEKQGILFKQEQVEDQIFLQVIKADNSASYQEFINRFPDGLNAVRAREYLENNPHKVTKKVTSNAKSWISSGKKDSSSWASAEQPPQYSSTRPSAVYTPPAGGGGKKLGDFFGADAEGMKKVEEEAINAPQETDPAAAIPFEDFEKPERLSGDPDEASETTGIKESRMDAGEPDPMQNEPETVTASLETLPDLTPVPVAELPAEVDPPKSEEMAPGEQQAGKTETAAIEEPVEQAQPEEIQQEAPQEAVPQEPQPEMAGVETTGPETVESESERIARIVKEEVAKAESAESEPAEPEPVKEVEVESPQETPMEMARVEPENQEPQPEMAPAENAAAEETPPVAEEPSVNPETVSETVAALMPTPPSPESMESPMDSEDPSSSMVVVKMREGATLNVRAKPSIQGEIMGYLENGDMMPFMSESGDWYQIEIEEGLSGWISKRYSTRKDTVEVASIPAEPAPEPEPASEEPGPSEPVMEEMQSSELTPIGAAPVQPEGVMVVVTVSEGAILNVRSLPSPNGAIVDMLFRGDKLPMVKEEGDWYQVEFDDETTGWISKKFSIIEGSTLKASLPAPVEKKEMPKTRKQKSKDQNSNEMVTTVVVVKVPKGSSLNVRSTPSSQGQVMGSLQSGDMRPLLEEADEWYQVELPDGQPGWISRKFSGKMDVDSSFLQGP